MARAGKMFDIVRYYLARVPYLLLPELTKNHFLVDFFGLGITTARAGKILILLGTISRAYHILK